jgi:hypothetical protein
VRRSAAPFAVVLVAVLAIGGCGTSEGDQPVVIPPVTSEPTSASTSPSSAAGKPAPSSGGTGKPSDAELIAVAVGYYEAVERAFRTLETRELETLGTPSCRGCAMRLATLNSAERRNHRVDGGHYDYTERVVLGGGTPTRQSVRLSLRFSGLEIRDASGRLVQRVQPSRRVQQIDLVLNGDRWRVAEIFGLEE